MQLIHDPRAHLYHLVPMPQQLSQAPDFPSSVPGCSGSDLPPAISIGGGVSVGRKEFASGSRKILP
jgi:hypothetical protein